MDLWLQIPISKVYSRILQSCTALNIKVILCHGIAFQLRQLAEERNIDYTDDRGEGPTNESTLQLAIDATGIASAQIMKGLSQRSLPYNFCNAVQARQLELKGGSISNTPESAMA